MAAGGDMTEKLLQFIWEYRYFNHQGLALTTGEPVWIEYPGDENQNQGPDFTHARIRIRDTYWVGNVELHLFSSGWKLLGIRIGSAAESQALLELKNEFCQQKKMSGMRYRQIPAASTGKK